MTTVPTSRVRAVLLDVDGTLIAGVDAQARAWRDALIDRVASELSAEARKEAAALRKRRYLDAYVSAVRPTPGARALVERIIAAGMLAVVASSGEPDEVAAGLEIARVRDLIADGADSGDAAHAKPDPDVIEAALRKADVPAAAAVMLGDTPYDIAAATKAGVRAIALRCGGHDDDALGAAIAVYDDPADLLAHFAEAIGAS